MKLPSGWEYSELGNCVSTMKSGLSRLLSSEDIGLPMLRSCNIGENYSNFEKLKYWYIDDPQGADTANYILNDGDILLNFINSIAQIGKSCIFRNLIGRNCIYTTNILRLTANSKIDKQFLYLVTKTNRYKWFISTITKPAVNQASFTTKDLKKYKFPLPPLPEQTASADLLSAWDAAIEKIERLIAAKEKRFKCLSTRYLFGLVNAKALSSKRTRWFAVPERWEIVRIEKIAKEVKSTNGSNQDIPVLSCTKYDGLVDSLSYFGKQVFSVDTSKYKVVKKGQFAYATNHIEEGSIGYQNLYPKGLVSPMYTVFETNQFIDDSYLYKVLKTDIYRHIFQVNTSASVDRRGSLRWKEFAKLPIPLPPMKEQKRIADILNTARKEIDLLKKQLEAFRKQKRGLMQKLLTGQWRVKITGVVDQ